MNRPVPAFSAAQSRREPAVQATSNLPTRYGRATLVTFSGLSLPGEHSALIYGDALEQEAPLVRVHSKCLTGDTFGSLRCDCGEQLRFSFRAMTRRARGAEPAGGIVLYLDQEGRGIGLNAKNAAYQVQDQLGLDTFEANVYLGHPEDARTYDVAKEMLDALGVKTIDVLSDNDAKVRALRKAGVDIRTVHPIKIRPNMFNARYLAAKAAKNEM